MKKVAVIGATGYTGQELVRLLSRHPQIEIEALSSEQSAGLPYSHICPQFRGSVDLPLERLDVSAIAGRVDLAFLCLPHGESAKQAAAFLRQDKVVIDLSADCRLRSKAVYAEWYGLVHPHPEILKEAVYGLPELLSESLQGKKLIANPGCYPTGIALGLAPLLAEKAIALDAIICDSKSGVTGAGRSVKPDMLFTELNENFYAYKIASHRHTPEIEQTLSELAGEPVRIQFTPHLLPVSRGILSTLYVRPRKPWTEEALRDLYRKFYHGKPFVRMLPKGIFPQLRAVVMSNFCDIGLTHDARTGWIVIVSAIDNLTKGASGQAVQNMNLVFGWPETLGLM